MSQSVTEATWKAEVPVTHKRTRLEAWSIFLRKGQIKEESNRNVMRLLQLQRHMLVVK